MTSAEKKKDEPATQPNAPVDNNDPDDVKNQEEEKPVVKKGKLGKNLASGMEHLEGSKLLKVQVMGPVVVRRDPETGRVHEHRRGSTFLITQKELDAMNDSGVRSKPVRIVKKDEDEDE